MMSMTACGKSDNISIIPETPIEPAPDDNRKDSILITIGGKTIIASMENNASARDFISRLPLDITLNDYNDTTEKIFHPTPELTTEGVTRGCTPVPGDITIYIPWGNVGIFCKAWRQSNDLIKIGHIEKDGIEELSVAGDIDVRIEKL